MKRKIIFYIILFGVFGGIVWIFASKPAIPMREPERFVASVPPRSIHQISSKEISRVNSGRKEVIFTFDGGAGILSADKVLEVLAKHKVRGTFFLTGKFVEVYPDLAKRIVAGGYEVFNHTYDHKDLTTLSDEKIIGELKNTEGVFSKILNISPKPYFRPPYGARNSKVLEVAFGVGYQSVYWTVDALDWQEGKTSAEVKTRILVNLASGNIYLMHVGDKITGEILDDVFTKIEARGYKIVSLSQGLKD